MFKGYKIQNYEPCTSSTPFMFYCPQCGSLLIRQKIILDNSFCIYHIECTNLKKCGASADSVHSFDSAMKLLVAWFYQQKYMNGLGGSGARPERP